MKISVFCLCLCLVSCFSLLGASLGAFTSLKAEDDPNTQWYPYRGNVDLNYQSKQMIISSDVSNPSIVVFTGDDYTDYTLEADVVLTGGAWFGVAYKVTEDGNGIYISKKSGEANERAVQTFKSAWGTPIVADQTTVGYDDYVHGDKVHIKVQVKNDKISVWSTVKGGSTVCEFSDVALDASVCGRGLVGLALSANATAYVDNVTIKNGSSVILCDFSTMADTVVDNTNENDMFEAYRGTSTLAQENGRVNVTASSVASIVYKEQTYTHYEMTMDLCLNTAVGGNSIGIVFRTNGDVQGLFLLKVGSNQSNPRAVKYMTGTKYSSTNTAVKSSGYSAFEYGQPFSVKVRVYEIGGEDVIDCLVKTASDADYKTVFEGVKIPEATYGTTGYVGMFTSKGMASFDNFNIVELDSTGAALEHTRRSLSFDQQEKPDSPVGEYEGTYATLDGNNAIRHDDPLGEMFSTLEVWYRSSAKQTQPLFSNYRNAAVEANSFKFEMNEAGQIRYYETNGDNKVDISSNNSYCDGEWYRYVLTREYNENSGILVFTIRVFDTDGELKEKVTQIKYACERKKNDYVKNGSSFSQLTAPYTGTDYFWENYAVGDIGEIRVYGMVLSQDEMTSGSATPSRSYTYKTENGKTISLCNGTEEAIVAELFVDKGDMEFYTGDYSFAVIPDIQRLVEYYPSKVDAYFDWIIAKADEMNVKFVISVGDLVHTPTAEQFDTISRGAKKLLDAGIQFMFVPGNHDYEDSNRKLDLFNQYFDYDTFSSQTSFVDTFEDGRMENAYYEYSVGDVKYLVVCLELAPRDSVIAWANDIIKKHPRHRVILTQHAYLDVSGELLNKDPDNYFYASHYQPSSCDAQYLWDNLISQHENIFLNLCGHMGSSEIIYRTDIGKNRNEILTVLLDAERMDTSFEGAGAISIFTMDEENRELRINHYSIHREQFIGENNQLVLPITVREPEAVKGDCDGDGAVTNNDVMLLVRYLSGWDVDAEIIDLTDDGRISNRDALYLIRLLTGWVED